MAGAVDQVVHLRSQKKQNCRQPLVSEQRIVKQQQKNDNKKKKPASSSKTQDRLTAEMLNTTAMSYMGNRRWNVDLKTIRKINTSINGSSE